MTVVPEIPPPSGRADLGPGAGEFLLTTAWSGARCEAIPGDASTRRYFRLRQGDQTAILMDSSHSRETIAPFERIARHLLRFGFSAPEILAQDGGQGFMVIEDFGDATFTRLLAEGFDQEELYTLATEVLMALHAQADAIPEGLREYHPARMWEDIELFLDWGAPAAPPLAREEFRRAWQAVLPLAHLAPRTLLLRDYHVANLMLLPGRQGLRRAGLLDFQDAYQGPVTYDLMSLWEDARRDVPEWLKSRLRARYLDRFPNLDREAFDTSMAVVAALRHARVLAIFERLSAIEGKHAYKQLHSPRVRVLLRQALDHPALAPVKEWFDHHAR